MAEENKGYFMLIAIVAIVAIVAVVMLVGRGATKQASNVVYTAGGNEGNLGGQAFNGGNTPVIKNGNQNGIGVTTTIYCVWCYLGENNYQMACSSDSCDAAASMCNKWGGIPDPGCTTSKVGSSGPKTGQN